MGAEPPVGKGRGLATTRLALVDDNHLVREGLRDMLADEPDIEVVGEAADGREAVDLCSRLQPDLVLMDVRMPNMDGLASTREVKRRYPKTSVLMVTAHDDPDYLLEALKAGAAGYVLKDATQDEIIAAVRQVREGESPLDPQLATRLLKRLTAEGKDGTRGRRGGQGGGQGSMYYVEPLTPREFEVLGLMKLGQTNPQIAETLVISRGTAKNHVEHIITKLGVSDRTQAVVRALELGLLNLSE